MYDINIKELIDSNHRLSLLLGYSMSFITTTSRLTAEDEKKYQWLIKSIENVLYLNKPLPVMP